MADPILSQDLKATLTNKVINEAFSIARSNRTGILSVVNFSDPMVAYDGYKMGWLDFRVDADSDTLNGAVLAAATTLVVDDGSKFRAGMNISATGSDEVIAVSAVSGNNLTVVRGFGGTVAEDIADDTVLTINSNSREENSVGADDGIYQPDPIENYFQTMDTMVTMSRRAMSTNQFGDTNNLAFQVAERMRQLTIQMDRALVTGRRATLGTGNDLRTYTGGMRFFTDQTDAIKVDESANALTLDMINNANSEIVARGGFANTIAVGISKARELNALVSSNYQSQRLADWSNDEGAVTRLPSDIPLLGTATQIVVDTNLSDNELFIFDSGMISVKPMAAQNGAESGAWQTKDAAQNGQDGQAVRVIGDFAMEIRQSKTHMARLHNLG